MKLKEFHILSLLTLSIVIKKKNNTNIYRNFSTKKKRKRSIDNWNRTKVNRTLDSAFNNNNWTLRRNANDLSCVLVHYHYKIIWSWLVENVAHNRITYLGPFKSIRCIVITGDIYKIPHFLIGYLFDDYKIPWRLNRLRVQSDRLHAFTRAKWLMGKPERVFNPRSTSSSNSQGWSIYFYVPFGTSERFTLYAVSSYLNLLFVIRSFFLLRAFCNLSSPRCV